MDESALGVHRPKPCAGDSNAPVDGPLYFPAATQSIELGESFSADLDGGGPETIALEGTDAEPSLSVEGDGQASGVSLEASPLGLSVSTTLVEAGKGRRGVLVTRSGADSAEMQLYVYIDGDLVLAEDTKNDVRFGHAGYGSPAITWLSAGGELFTRRPTSDGPAGQFDVWRWQIDGAALFAEQQEPVCFDFESTPVSWRACS
jgi:hypothetical protein